MTCNFKKILIIITTTVTILCNAKIFADDSGRSELVEQVCANNKTIQYNKNDKKYYSPPSGYKTISYPDPNNTKFYGRIYYYFLNYNGGKCIKLTTHPGPHIRNHCEAAEVYYNSHDSTVSVSRSEYSMRITPHELDNYLTLCGY